MICVICGSETFAPLYRLSRHIVEKCASCGLMQNGTFFQDERFRTDLFERNYYESVQSNAFKNRLDDFENDPSVPIYRHNLRKLAKQGVASGHVLDVGSAFGTFLKVAADLGWIPTGVELSNHSSAIAREHWGFDIRTGDLLQTDLEFEKFDLVTFWDVIEHVGNPRENLAKARDVLKPRGTILLTSDNYASLMALLGRAAYTMTGGTLQYALERFYIPYNTFYFTPATMTKLLRNAGFELVRFEMIDYPIEKLNLSLLEKAAVRTIYAFGDLVRMNTQFLVVAKKI